MFPGGTQAEWPRVLPLHERHSSHSHAKHHPYPYPLHPPLELPRTLEPKPSHLSQSDISSAQVHKDSFTGSANRHADQRNQGQSLPRLHDILTSGTPTPSRAWNAPAPPPTSHQSSDGYYSHAGWHPPLAYPPMHDAPSAYHAHPNGRVDLPVLESTPAGRPLPPTVPMSPFPAYPENAGDYMEARHDSARQITTSSYYTNGLTSPYAPPGSEDSQYRVSAQDRGVPGAFGQPVPESSRKYMGVRDVPGEGSYHLYEGGYRIPTHVDGETVNPAWGLTKANKPRKRLAMACLDCREKKIKCEPGAVSCLQCEKAKRPCRKAPSHQSQGDPAAGSAWQNDSTIPVRKGVSDPTPREGEFDATGKRRPRDDPSPPNVPTKKHRSASPQLASESASMQMADGVSLQTSPTLPDSPRGELTYDDDPSTVQPTLTAQLVEGYFSNINDAEYCIFPRRHFLRWMTTSADKTLDERLVLYAMLAVGSNFTEEPPSLHIFGKHYASLATQGLQSRPGHISMTVIQTRLILGLYYFSRGLYGIASDHIGAAVYALNYVRYNTEQALELPTSQAHGQRQDFALSYEQLTECKRRTMWVAFLIDRCLDGERCTINSQDIFLRLPCADDDYEQGLPTKAPYFNNGMGDPADSLTTPASAMNPMAWTILVASIWGDVVNYVSRSPHWAHQTYKAAYQKLYDETKTALEGWLSRLPLDLHFDIHNVEKSIRGRYSGSFVSMHVLYHFTLMKLNRCVKHDLIPDVRHNVRTTHDRANSLLNIISTKRHISVGISSRDDHVANSSPFLGFAMQAAIDVISAGGKDSTLLAAREQIDSGLYCLRALENHWESARAQHKTCETRDLQVKNVTTHPQRAQSGCWLNGKWGMSYPIDQTLAPEDDCIYGIDSPVYFEALQEGSENGRVQHAGGLRLV